MKRKFLILTPKVNGYFEFVKNHLQNQGHDCELIYTDDNSQKLPFNKRVKSLWLKLRTGQSLRKHQRNQIITKWFGNQRFDAILCTRPEFFSQSTHELIQSLTKDYVIFLFDSLERVPAQKKVIPYAKRAYAFDPRDVDENVKFITNYIPSEEFRATENSKDIFFIGAEDERLPFLKKLSVYLKAFEIPYQFIIVGKKNGDKNGIEFRTQNIAVDKMLELMKSAGVLIDVVRSKNSGLSFRVFEALGSRKKLITTNTTIKDYDFYNPQNILVLDPKKDIHIPDDFMNTPYIDPPESVYNKYTLASWCKEIFNLE